MPKPCFESMSPAQLPLAAKWTDPKRRPPYLVPGPPKVKGRMILPKGLPSGTPPGPSGLFPSWLTRVHRLEQAVIAAPPKRSVVKPGPALLVMLAKQLVPREAPKQVASQVAGPCSSKPVEPSSSNHAMLAEPSSSKLAEPSSSKLARLAEPSSLVSAELKVPSLSGPVKPNVAHKFIPMDPSLIEQDPRKRPFPKLAVACPPVPPTHGDGDVYVIPLRKAMNKKAKRHHA